jgi:hypothetical protein
LSETLLVVFFEDVNYGGYESEVYGSDGTCDHAGYGIDDMDGVNDDVNGVSSYQLIGNCDASEKFSDYNLQGTYSGIIVGQNQSWVGSQWNDGGFKSFFLWQHY